MRLSTDFGKKEVQRLKEIRRERDREKKINIDNKGNNVIIR